ncbi:hypothetical protein LshimejAT787_0103630 [Lyophyllum shimeji]|uniref:DUF6534 domain-containing protein n=1 Tax=Lyophyllum shimeji TaxID=47721 RepID=A0A9P3PDH2_LYOSH|nr:hypothetical protein LshimejAT787_0103630 [Lyophyllum shimeji]
MSTSPAAKAAQLTAAVKQVFGTSFIGFTIATTLYGITCLQTYIYYRNYRKDPQLLKATVAALWVLDTLTTIFVAHSLYTFFVLNFGKPPQVDLIIPWSFTSEKLLVTLITFIAQVFYARTIWRVSSNKSVPVVIVLLALAALALGIVTTEHLFRNPLTTSISDRKFSILSGLVQGFASLDDILITVALCYFLQTRRGGEFSSQNRTDVIIDSLMLYAVSRGILTAVTQILFLVLNVALPHDTFWQPFHQAVGKLYVNSVLATLNIRSAFNEPTEVKLGGLQFESGVDSAHTGLHASQHVHTLEDIASKTTAYSSTYGASEGKRSMKLDDVAKPEA